MQILRVFLVLSLLASNLTAGKTNETTEPSSTIETFTIAETTQDPSYASPNIVVEVEDGDDVAAEMDPIGVEEVREVDLTNMYDDSDNESSNDTKIETNAILDTVPKIINRKLDEESKSKFGVMHELVFDDVDEENITSVENSTSSDRGRAFLKPDGVILPTPKEEDYFASENATNTSDYEPLTFWNHTRLFVSWFSSKNSLLIFFILALISSIFLLVAFLVVRNCCRRRWNTYTYPAHVTGAGGVTDDLYNTSSFSHRYTKVTLPDQKEVTMQLVSADCSMDDI
uniref:Uncharacterized protein n=1 Tax=Caenorhabditis japonica TaxID=281687 RepID=A0A8R1HUT3_CAEJA